MVNEQRTPMKTPHAAGETIAGDKIMGDKITAGDVRATNVAIGRGAQVIVNQIHEALSAVEEMEKGIQAAERRLAVAIGDKIARYAALDATSDEPDGRRNPYKALLDYKLEDAPYFYGRADAIAAMMERMRQGRLTVLHSDSGSGKTSLLQAGLASRLLAAGHFPLYLRPYRQPPGQYIKRAFLPDYATQPELARFRDDQISLKGFLERVTHYLGGRQLYIFLDQFEEFFTELDPDAQGVFAARLQDCVESDLPVWWVMALRKEYFSDLRAFSALRPYDNEYFLPTFRLEEAQDVVTEPARLKGITYEDGLVDDILADLHQEGEGISPAQVQLVCFTLFEEKALEQPVITRQLYQQQRGRGEGRPGAEGILGSHLSRVLDNTLRGTERKVAGQVLEALVTSDLHRVMKSEEALQTAVGDKAQTLEYVLDVLHENRLIHRSLDEEDQPRYELTHDYLLAQIELDPETRSRKLAQEMLDHDVSVWRQRREQELLIAEDRLILIERYLDVAMMSEEQKHLVNRSRQAIDQQNQAETQRLKRELATQRQLTWRTRIFLVAVSLTAIALAIAPAQRIYWRSQARNDTELIPILVEALPRNFCNSETNQAICDAIAQGRVDSFQIEKYEVSNARYALCVRAGACTVPNSERYVQTAYVQFPVQGVNALQASAFCRWIGRRLPTEWQWLIALGSPEQDFSDFHELGPVTNPVYVSYAGATNLLGNVSEWTRSYYQEDLNHTEEVLWNEMPETLSFDRFLIMRGDSYLDSATRVTVNGRVTDQTFGIRCLASAN